MGRRPLRARDGSSRKGRRAPRGGPALSRILEAQSQRRAGRGRARLSLEVGAMIPKAVFEETVLQFFAPVRAFLDDPAVSEIMINGPEQIYIERKGILELTDAKFASRDALMAALRNL